jgi:hypothetical protein
MTERQMFGAVVRGVGVYLAAYGSIQIWMEVIIRLLVVTKDEMYRYTAMHDFLYGLTFVAVGYLLIRRPDWIIQLDYEREVEPDHLSN